MVTVNAYVVFWGIDGGMDGVSIINPGKKVTTEEVRLSLRDVALH
jgi:hypothetical protein